MSRKTRRKQKSKKKNPETGGGDPTVLTWRVHPLRDNFARSAFALAVLLLMGGLGWMIFSDSDIITRIVVGLGTMLVLFLAMSRFFLPTVYKFDNEGFDIKNGLFRKSLYWDNFKAFKHDEGALMLSPFESPSRLRSLRAVLLLLDRKRREEIISFVHKKVAVDETTRSDTE